MFSWLSKIRDKITVERHKIVSRSRQLVDLLQSRAANTKADGEQLFRRALFNILIHDTDDHRKRPPMT